MLSRFQVRLGQRLVARPAWAYSAPAHERQRFNVLAAVALLKLFNLFGGVWDIQWHVAIGRDSLWIPPHMLVTVAFVGGFCLVIGWIAYESILAQSGAFLQRTVSLGPSRSPLVFYIIFFAYTGALLSAGFDDLWHRLYGIDVTLWSPPHLCIMFFTMLVDYSLLIGLTASAWAMGWRFSWRTLYFWLFLLAGAYTLEAVNFQMAEAFIVGYRARGTGLTGLLYPLMVGTLFPMSLLLMLNLARRFWAAGLIFLLALGLQYVGVGVAAAGFAILHPVSQIEEFVRLNPASTISLARQFASQIGFNGLIGFEQAWTMSLSGVPLGLVSLLALWPWAQRRLLLAAPVYSAGLVLTCYVWFQFIPLLRDYSISVTVLSLSVLLAAAGGLLFGWIGTRLSHLVELT
jgi:hypothetical protein